MKRSITILALASLAALGLAQAAPNLSGEWKLNPAKSEFGPVPAPELMTRKIQHNDPSLEISTHQKGVQGEATTQLKYTTDGKECVNKVQGGEAKGTANWQGDSLVIENIRDFQGTEIKSKETWILSEGGKVLTIRSHFALPQTGEFDIKLVFDRQ